MTPAAQALHGRAHKQQQQHQQHHFPPRPSSFSSDSSSSSQITALSRSTPGPHLLGNAHDDAASTSSLASSKASVIHAGHEIPPRRPSPMTASSKDSLDFNRNRSRQHSQGFFEPSLPTASHAALTPQQIAAQAAMQVQNTQQARKRSQTIPDPAQSSKPRKPSNSPIPGSHNNPFANPSSAHSRSVNPGRPGHLEVNNAVATTAANAAFPRSPLQSPSLSGRELGEASSSGKEQKPAKEKSRMKLFSKPRHVATSKDKDVDKRNVPSPKKLPGSSHFSAKFNQSTTSLAESSASSSLYSSLNASTSTLVPTDKPHTGDKERHRHNFLSRQKYKHKDDHHLPLSSASSNSRPADPNAPQTLYSFAPSSPGPSSTFNKSISGLDLRHGGRALREKKREEKAAASSFFSSSNLAPDGALRDREGSVVTAEWLPSGLPSAGATSAFSNHASEINLASQNLTGFGLAGMGVDDAWPLLKARLLNIFEGEDLRTPVEDFNRLLNVHIQRCIQRRAPSVIIEDFRELLTTGFSSLDQTLTHIPDERLVPHVVDMWLFIFGTLLPFMQAVFLPLDLELKGRGTLMNNREAAEFWGALPILSKSSSTESSSTNSQSAKPAVVSQTSLGQSLDVRTLVLLTFRDVVILPRHDIFLAIFSRLSLDSINAAPIDLPESFQQYPPRPGTGASSASAGGSADHGGASYNSQGSTMLDSSNAGSLGARSRATSNTSAGSFQSLSSQRRLPPILSANPAAAGPQARSMDSSKVTETAARMLQCISVLAGLQGPGSFQSRTSTDGPNLKDEDEVEMAARRKMERLAKEIKLNWMGRGRTGRNRRGFVGTKTTIKNSPGVGVSA